MNVTGKRLGFAQLLTAGDILSRVYMMVTGAAVDFYDHIPGTDAQAVAQAPFQGCLNSHVAVSRNDMPIHSSKFMPGHLTNRG